MRAVNVEERDHDRRYANFLQMLRHLSRRSVDSLSSPCYEERQTSVQIVLKNPSGHYKANLPLAVPLLAGCEDMCRVQIFGIVG